MGSPQLHAQILIVREFLDRELCERLVARTGPRETRGLGVLAVTPRATTPTLDTTSIVDAARLVRVLIEAGARHPLARYLPRPLARALARARSITDLGEGFPFQLTLAFKRAICDAAFYARHRERIELPPGSVVAAELEALERRGGADELHLRWFHVRVLEDVVFPGLVRATTRVLARELDPRAPLAVFGGLADTFRSAGDDDVADRFARGTYFDAAEALALVFASDERGQPILTAYAALDDGPAAIAEIRPHERLHRVLHRLYPRYIAPPPAREPSGRRVVPTARTCRTVDITDIRAELVAACARFVREHVEPHYGVTVTRVEDCQLLKYEPGNFHAEHQDAWVKEPTRDGPRWTRRLDRDLSVILYLNDPADYDGGELVFPRLRVSVRPDRGMAVAFPSDFRFPHAVTELTRGHRWAVVTWFAVDDPARLLPDAEDRSA